jgi:hypothetical protein
MWPGHIQDQIINFTCVLWVILPTPFLQSKKMWAGRGPLKVGQVSFMAGQSKRRHLLRPAMPRDVALLELDLLAGQPKNWLGSDNC